MDDVREELTAIDRALVDALDVHESADFAARVRRRIATEPARGPFQLGWRIVLPVAAAALVLVAAGVATLSMRTPSAPRLLTARPFVSVQTFPAADDPVRFDRAGLAAPRASRLAPPAAVSARANTEPEVLVPREEIEMYRRLMTAAQNAPGAMLVEAPKDLVASGAMSEITIDPIKIELIIPPVSGEGDRQ